MKFTPKMILKDMKCLYVTMILLMIATHIYETADVSNKEIKHTADLYQISHSADPSDAKAQHVTHNDLKVFYDVIKHEQPDSKLISSRWLRNNEVNNVIVSRTFKVVWEVANIKLHGTKEARVQTKRDKFTETGMDQVEKNEVQKYVAKQYMTELDSTVVQYKAIVTLKGRQLNCDNVTPQDKKDKCLSKKKYGYEEFYVEDPEAMKKGMLWRQGRTPPFAAIPEGCPVGEPPKAEKEGKCEWVFNYSTELLWTRTYIDMDPNRMVQEMNTYNGDGDK